MTFLLHARDLSISRGDRTLFEGFHLAIEPGQAIHLKGRNGAGKTSLLEVLAGLRPAAGGTVEGGDPSQRHWIGHRNALNGDLTAGENLAYWCALQGVDPSPIDAALERMGLSKVRRRETRTFSAGQKRRATLARLLLVRRPLWLLDEPLSGLDVDGVALFGGLLAEHLAADGAVLVTSHQPLPGRLPRVTIRELPMSAFLATLAREYRLALRHKAEWLLPPLFFAIVVALFAFGGEAADPRLAAFAPSILWVGALLAALLTLDRLFRPDFEDGVLEQVFTAPTPALFAVAGKLIAHWLFTGLPLVILAAPLAFQLGAGKGTGVPALLLGLLLGTPVLSLVGGFAAALTVGLPRAGLLLPVLVLPLLVPVVIFGAGAARAAQAGLDASGPIYFLAAMLAAALTLLPWAATVALRNAFD